MFEDLLFIVRSTLPSPSKATHASTHRNDSFRLSRIPVICARAT